MSKDVLENAELEMDSAQDSLKRRLGKIRTGKASPALLDGMMVEYYGTPTLLKQLATVAAPEARMLTVKPFDRSSIGAIEKSLGRTAEKVLEPIQPGDVEKTWADVSALVRDYGYNPGTPVEEGIRKFVDWYKSYYTA